MPSSTLASVFKKIKRLEKRTTAERSTKRRNLSGSVLERLVQRNQRFVADAAASAGVSGDEARFSVAPFVAERRRQDRLASASGEVEEDQPDTQETAFERTKGYGHIAHDCRRFGEEGSEEF